METIRSSNTSVLTKATRRHIPEEAFFIAVFFIFSVRSGKYRGNTSNQATVLTGCVLPDKYSTVCTPHWGRLHAPLHWTVANGLRPRGRVSMHPYTGRRRMARLLGAASPCTLTLDGGEWLGFWGPCLHVPLHWTEANGPLTGDRVSMHPYTGRRQMARLLGAVSPCTLTLSGGKWPASATGRFTRQQPEDVGGGRGLCGP
jgi:hypothetical protein